MRWMEQNLVAKFVRGNADCNVMRNTITALSGKPLNTRAMAGLAAFAVLTGSAHAQFTLTQLPAVSGYNTSRANAISADGTRVLGMYGYSGLGLLNYGCYWSLPSGTVTSLTSAPSYSGVYGGSNDGSVLVGAYTNNLLQRGFRWTNNVFTDVGSLNSLTGTSWAYDTNSDGSVIVGTTSALLGVLDVPFRWVNSTMTQLPMVPSCANGQGAALSVSSDGSIVCGYESPPTGGNTHSFYWSSGSSGVSTELLFQSGGFGQANAVSGNGQFIVGKSSISGVDHAFRYQLGGSLPMGATADLGANAEATAVSNDGHTVVGFFNNGTVTYPIDPFIWTARGGFINLREYLDDNGVAGAANWTNARATGISADGTLVVGYGNVTSILYQQGFVAKIPAAEPPIAAADSATVTMNTPLSLNVLANDQYVSPNRTVTTSSPSHGSVVVNADESITYTPVTGYTGTDTFTYTVVNTPPSNPSAAWIANAASSACTATVTLTVRPTFTLSLLPANVTGGTSTIGRVNFNGTVTGSYTVSLAAIPSTYVSMPATVTVTNSNQVSFTISTSTVTTTTSPSIRVSGGGYAVSRALTISP